MKYDIFFSISQTPAGGVFPSEATMFRNFFEQVRAADEQGYGVAWIAESHLSSEVQKRNPHPVIPHWKGEVGLNVDFLQTATRVFQQTERIECGSAIVNILCNGGPVAAAERVAAFLSFHGLDPNEKRRLHFGFAAGRFDFMNRAYGIGPRNPLEERAWRAIKGQLFGRAGEIFCRLINGETLGSRDVPPVRLTAANFRTPEEWATIRSEIQSDTWEIPPFYRFEPLKIIPTHLRHALLQLIVGSHDPAVQDRLNTITPVQVFNLSITRPEVIQATHDRMAKRYHPDGGAWQRSYMPRTTFVFINANPALSAASQSSAAHREADEAMRAYWTALEGTIDPQKVKRATENALIGNPSEIAAQIRERFHPEDRLMLWFDFFNHNSDRVIENMAAFQHKVVPLVEGAKCER